MASQKMELDMAETVATEESGKPGLFARFLKCDKKIRGIYSFLFLICICYWKHREIDPVDITPILEVNKNKTPWVGGLFDMYDFIQRWYSKVYGRSTSPMAT